MFCPHKVEITKSEQPLTSSTENDLQAGLTKGAAHKDFISQNEPESKSKPFLHEQTEAETVEAVVQYARQSYKKDIADDILFPKSEREQHAFIRSYANKTIGLKGNKKKRIIITTANHAYLCDANGYLKGEIVDVWQIDGNEDNANLAIEEFKDGTYSGRKTFDSTSKRTRDESRRNGSYIFDVNNDGTETRDVDIAGDESGSGGERNSREVNKNQEKIEQRSIQTDSEGNPLSEEQQRYFADSKVRDENGNLTVVYHGTDADFTVFDRTRGRLSRRGGIRKERRLAKKFQE